MALLIGSAGPQRSELGMIGDISTIGEIHAAYIHGSIPTAAQEADDIMNLPFPDARNGSDAKEWMPSAYIRGSIDTSAQEAQDITGVAMDPRKEILYQTKAKTSKLGMIGDIKAINHIHAAYIHGSIPTFAQESDEITTFAFPDERNGSDSKSLMPSAYIRGSIDTSAQEASDITGVAKDPVKRRLQAKQSKLMSQHKPQLHARTTKLGMIGDISTINDIHAAYIHGSVPTAAQESDDIMNMPYPDERNGSDSKNLMPSAYVRGSIDTSAQEASDITGVAKDPVREKLMQREKKSAQLKMSSVDTNKERAKSRLQQRARMTKLGMTGDISTLKDIHAAYIHGSIPTAAQESDEITNFTFPDERHGSDSEDLMPSAYIRGSIDTSAQEATDITGVAEDTVKRMLKGRQELLMQKPGQQQATLTKTIKDLVNVNERLKQKVLALQKNVKRN
uniref:Uncharacterized protein n=1 Tax=Hanusia phi TaxID=3032 RepID=A0A7S0HX51_9CRYP